MKHGATEPIFGVKVGDMKKIIKKIKKDHELSLELYKTGNSDAMYFAGLIADESQITKAQLTEWAERATYSMISEYAVAWVAAETPHGWEIGLEWIESEDEKIASAGWSTLSNYISITPDEDIDIPAVKGLLNKIVKELQGSKNRVKYTMNGFVICAGAYVAGLTQKAFQAGEKYGKVEVDMNGTACKVPPVGPYLQKMIDGGRVGKKRKQARC
jgi:hypothetical protein